MSEDKMILVGRYRSPFTRRVAVSLRVLGFSYELRPRTAWQHLEEVSALNPLGRVPVLILADGEAIFDSGAILDYLDGRVGPERALVPPPGPERRQVQRLIALAIGVIDKGRELFYETDLRPEALRHPPWIARWRGQIESGLRALDAQGAAPWLAGDHMTQADITAGVMYDFTRLYHPDLLPDGRYPRLDAHIAACAALPAFSDTTPEPE